MKKLEQLPANPNPEDLYDEHKRLTDLLSQPEYSMTDVNEARAVVDRVATMGLIDRIRARKAIKEARITINNHQQAVNSGSGDSRDMMAATADAAQKAYDANLERIKQHLAEHPEQYSIPKPKDTHLPDYSINDEE